MLRKRLAFTFRALHVLHPSLDFLNALRAIGLKTFDLTCEPEGPGITAITKGPGQRPAECMWFASVLPSPFHIELDRSIPSLGQ